MRYVGLFVLSLLLTYLVKRIALKRAILDIPNERSSHTVPVPRGGGVAIILVFYLGLLWIRPEIDPCLFQALLWGIPVALISLLDDLLTLSSRVRLAVQAFAAAGALYSLGGVERIDLGFLTLSGQYLNVLAFLAMIWIVNLYNFLDGIDGYAAMEAMVMGTGIVLFLDPALGWVILASVAGFLFFNWHKASIFMGDVGSATLGFIFSVVIFYRTDEGMIYGWLVLLAPFWFDATVTLIRRWKQGEAVMSPHKKHAYQRLVQSGWRHDQVVWAVLGIDLLFLVLLYAVHPWWIVFLLNLLTMVFLYRSVEQIKAFS